MHFKSKGKSPNPGECGGWRGSHKVLTADSTVCVSANSTVSGRIEPGCGRARKLGHLHLCGWRTHAL
eukprot:919593-Prorocentrum_minimum.AAC.1